MQNMSEKSATPNDINTKNEEMIICPECGVPVPASMERCPYCGIRMPRGCRMLVYRIIAAVVAIVAAIVLLVTLL